MTPPNGSITLKRSLLRSLLSDIDDLHTRLHAIATYSPPRPRLSLPHSRLASPPPGYTSMPRYCPPPMRRGGAWMGPVNNGKHKTPKVRRGVTGERRVDRGKGKGKKKLKEESEVEVGESEELMEGESGSGSESGSESEGNVVVYRDHELDGMGGAAMMGGPSGMRGPGGMGPIGMQSGR